MSSLRLPDSIAGDRLPLTLYFWMNVVMRGELALLAVYATNEAGLSVGEAAAGVAYATLVMRFGRTLAAPLFLGLSLRRTVRWCFLTVASGSALLCAGHGLATFVLGTTALGVGFGSCMLAIKVQVLVHARGNDDALAPLSVLVTLVNLGAALGPLALVAIAATAGRPTAFGVACGAALIGSLACSRLGDETAGSRPENPRRSRRWRGPSRPPTAALALLALITAAFALYSQLYVGLPLVAHRRGWESTVGWLLAINAAVVIIVQVPLGRRLIRVAEHRHAAATGGMVLLGLGVVTILLAPSAAAAAAGVVVFSIGECLTLPTLEAAATAAVTAERLGPLLMWVATAMGVGESVGAFLGVRILSGTDAAAASRSAAVVIAVAVGLVAAATWFVVAATARLSSAGPQSAGS